MVCKDDLLGMLTDIENQLEQLEEKIGAKVHEEKSIIIKERQLKVARAEKGYMKSEGRILVKMHLYGEGVPEKARKINNLELSYKTT
ncbi:hypothetical protein [Bacillus sp. AK031]